MRLSSSFSLLLVVLLTACSKADPLVPAAPTAPVAAKASPAAWVRYPEANIPLSAAATLGKQLFFDVGLSASGKMSCASCHSPEHAYAAPNQLAMQLGGRDMQQSGTRTVPSLRYLDYTPKFTRHFYQPSAEGVEDEGPTGGFTHDGALDSRAAQAAVPLLAAHEMANLDAAGFVQSLRHSSSASAFIKLYGAASLEQPQQALAQAGLALEAFQTEDFSFHPYRSKFDAVVAGKQKLSDAEARGFVVFHDAAKGNCAKCHSDRVGGGGRPAQFTDFAFAALGVPRNAAIPANKNPAYFDLGLCGPYRHDLAAEPEYCGMFKTPTLRNVATRSVFFHNGVFHSLDEVVHFYAQRDSHPGKWYAKRAGKVLRYDDLPARLRGNVNHVDEPFKAASASHMSEAEMQDLIAFLKTLNDE